MFKGLADKEDGLNQRAQEALAGMSRGSAAALLGNVMDKEDKIKTPSRYVISAANKDRRDVAKELEDARHVPIPDEYLDLDEEGSEASKEC